MITELIKHAAEIIKQAAESPLGIAALIIIIVSVIAILFFRKSSEKTRMVIFIFIIIGFLGFGLAISNILPLTSHKSLRQALENYSYELGWIDNNKRTFYIPLGKPTFRPDNFVEFSYKRDTGPGIIRVRLDNRKLTGTWDDQDGSGKLGVDFDENFAVAKGWWTEDRDTTNYPYLLFMRRIK